MNDFGKLLPKPFILTIHNRIDCNHPYHDIEQIYAGNRNILGILSHVN